MAVRSKGQEQRRPFAESTATMVTVSNPYLLLINGGFPPFPTKKIKNLGIQFFVVRGGVSE